MKQTPAKQTPEVRREAQFLNWFENAARELKTPANPSKRTVRNIVERRQSHRHQSPEMSRVVRQQTPNPIRAIFQSAETAARGHAGIEVPRTWEFWSEGLDQTTRNVGPHDLPDCATGKNTSSERGY